MLHKNSILCSHYNPDLMTITVQKNILISNNKTNYSCGRLPSKHTTKPLIYTLVIYNYHWSSFSSHFQSLSLLISHWIKQDWAKYYCIPYRYFCESPFSVLFINTYSSFIFTFTILGHNQQNNNDTIKVINFEC